MIHSEYISYLKTIGEAHQDVKKVTRMIYVDWPFRNTKLDQFFESQRSHDDIFPMMIVESYTNRFRDVRADNIDKLFDAGFIILSPAERNDFDDEDAKYDQAEQICEEIMGYMLHEFEEHLNARDTFPKRFIEPNSFQMEKTGSFSDNWVGVRASFQFQKNSTPALMYNPDKFNF